MIQKIKRSNFLIKLKSWEYWPFGIIQAPLFLYWLWLSLKSRSLLFFSASNPGILTGGMFGESKFEILEKIPLTYKPRGLLVKQPTSFEQVKHQFDKTNFSFPVIFKPDLGERGWMVKKIRSESEMKAYVETCTWDFIIQEYIHLPLEFSVFYHRFPGQNKGCVTSVTLKKMLTVTGDGKSTLQDLILSQDRSKLQWATLQKNYSKQLMEILPQGKEVELVPIGNHCLGTTFINRSDLINDKLNHAFDTLSKQILGFYFGRYDLRTASFEDLENGKVKIMELNGCGAEPSHIYHPGASLRKGMVDLFKHWQTIYEISKANHARGVDYLPLKQGLKIYKRFKASITA